MLFLFLLLEIQLMVGMSVLLKVMLRVSPLAFAKNALSVGNTFNYNGFTATNEYRLLSPFLSQSIQLHPTILFLYERRRAVWISILVYRLVSSPRCTLLALCIRQYHSQTAVLLRNQEHIFMQYTSIASRSIDSLIVVTSMSTPAIAGAAALVRQYLMEGYYPTGILHVH